MLDCTARHDGYEQAQSNGQIQQSIDQQAHRHACEEYLLNRASAKPFKVVRNGHKEEGEAEYCN